MEKEGMIPKRLLLHHSHQYTMICVRLQKKNGDDDTSGRRLAL
jgi:hypothetical protein